MSQVVDTELSLQCLQDGLFFGLDYLKKALSLSSIDSFYSDGDCVFKGQTALYIEPAQASQKREISLILSYLSGAYTLVSCFTEKRFDFDIYAGFTKNFSHKAGEKQAILKAGADFIEEAVKPELGFDEAKKRVERGGAEEVLLLSEEKMSRLQIQKILKECSQPFDLHGSFLPSDLEEFRSFSNIRTVYSSYLEGCFPCLKMQWSP